MKAMSPSSRQRLAHQGFTLVELLITIAIIGILSALIFPIAKGSIDRARASVCAANLKQLVAASRMYIQDHDGMFPTTYLYNLSTHSLPGVQDYLTSDNRSKVFQCPVLERDDKMTASTLSSTGGNTYTTSLTTSSNANSGVWASVYISRIELPTKTAWIMDGAWNGSTQFNSVIGRNQLPTTMPRLEYPHDDRQNVAFVDGHIEAIKRGDMPTDALDPFWTGKAR